jgi:hypothetical protein
MPWRGDKRLFCKVCGRAREEGERFSVRGKCDTCGPAMVIVNATQLHEHRGPFFDHWRMRSLAALGGVPLDASRSTTQTSPD